MKKFLPYIVGGCILYSIPLFILAAGVFQIEWMLIVSYYGYILLNTLLTLLIILCITMGIWTKKDGSLVHSFHGTYQSFEPLKDSQQYYVWIMICLACANAWWGIAIYLAGCGMIIGTYLLWLKNTFEKQLSELKETPYEDS